MMSPLAIAAVADELEIQFGSTALHSASGVQLESAEALLSHWIDRIQEARDERRMDVVGQNGPVGYEEVE